MNRNTQAHFAKYPSVSIGRSKFDRSFTHKTSWRNGQLIPLYVDMDIVPGDTVSMGQAEIVRMLTPIAPVMDNLVMDFYWFFIPNRLVMDEWKKLMGENDTAPWAQTADIQIPQVKMNNAMRSATNKLTRTVLQGSVLEKMGIPPQSWTYNSSGDKEIRISTLPSRAYCLVWNEFFRDQNYQNPVNVSKDSTDRFLVNENADGYISDPDAQQVTAAERGGLPPLHVCKTHDYFTSVLPAAQKSDPVTLPLTGNAPIIYGTESTPSDFRGERVYLGTDKTQAENSSGTAINTYTYIYTPERKTENAGGVTVYPSAWPDPVTMEADLTSVVGATVTQLRQAFAIQKFYERDARGGTRYIESIWSHFGVRNPDYRVQRPEYLGGHRMNINVSQVLQNSSTNSTSPLGETGAYSVTSNNDGNVFTKSFTEHGILMCVAASRILTHTYSQGINRAWFKKKRLDFYSPEFANLSEQAVLNQEIYAQGTDEDKEAFGYQEAWAEMRYMPDLCTSLMRPTTGNLGQVWTYADNYTQKPTAGDKWLQEDDTEVKRTLAVQKEDNFWGDFYFKATYTRPMPLYSIPGLIDHH